MKVARMICAALLIAYASVSAAGRMEDSFSGTCKPGPVQSIDAGDTPDHTYIVATASCTLSGTIGGAMAKQGAVAEHGEIAPTRVKTWGIHTLTLDTGDKVFLNYENAVVMQGGVFKSGRIAYRVTGGTGRMRGIKGAGTCTWIGDGDSFSCTGTTSQARP